MSCLQIWNRGPEKDREKEKSGGRPAKLKEILRAEILRARDKKTTNNEDENSVAAVRL